MALLSTADGGALLRVIAGDLAGHQGPGVDAHADHVVHATVSPGAQVRLPWRPDFNALGYVLAGNGTVGAQRRPVRTGQLDGLRARRLDHVRGRRAPAGGRARTSTCCSWAASRSGSPSPRTARS